MGRGRGSPDEDCVVDVGDDDVLDVALVERGKSDVGSIPDEVELVEAGAPAVD